MRIKKEFILREIAGDYVLVPVGDTVKSFNGLITLNELGVFIWKSLDDCKSKDEIIEKVLEEYDTDYDTAYNDISEFLSNLEKEKII